MRPVKAVFLDVGWTLIYPRRSIWECFAVVCEEAGVPITAQAAEDLIHDFIRITRPAAVERFSGGEQYTDSNAEFAAQFEAMGHAIFHAAGVSGDAAPLGKRFFEVFWNGPNWSVFPDVIEGLVTLRSRGVRLGVLSNAGTELDGFLELLGLRSYFDFTVVSAVEGTRKPDRRIFERALRRADVLPEEAIHVGDMYLEDILGARGAGVRALLMERYERAMFPSHPESANHPPDHVEIVRNLHEVVATVEG